MNKHAYSKSKNRPARDQFEKHALGRLGENIIARHTNGEKTVHKAPFDIVDFTAGVAYEVKAISGMSKDLKIHIANGSYERKINFASEYGLKMVLLAVVIYSEDHVELYKSELKQFIRVIQMTKLEVK